MYRLLAVAAVILLQFDHVQSHGRLIEPASRNAMWRFKYKNPRNYNDMGLNCGGFTNQFEKNGGRCGLCGDPWNGEREHEAGGKYANGVIARQYKVGSFINVTATLTSNHMGYFEFRLCPVNNPRRKATQACLDQHLLNIAGHGTRYFIMDKRGYVNIQLFVMLPPNLSCAQCVFQWKYVAGQSMGPDGFGGECLGCGNQEHFINCADIAIGDRVIAPLPQRITTPSPPTTAAPQGHNGLQVLTVGLSHEGAPTVYASGPFNPGASQNAFSYSPQPVVQPPTAHSTPHNHHGHNHGWSGSQANSRSYSPQPAQITYKTIQETQPQPASSNNKILIFRKPNPYETMKAQSQASSHQQAQSPKPNGKTAQVHTYHPPTKHAQPNQKASQYPQHKSHVPQAPSYPQPQSSYPQSNSFTPQASSHVLPATSYIQPSSQVPSYPQMTAQVPKPQPQQQTNQHVQSHQHLQSKSYVPTSSRDRTGSHTMNNINTMSLNLNDMKANLFKMFPNLMEGLDWMGEIATPTPTDPSQLSYPGYEPGEYPEPGEGPATQRPGGSGGQPSSYMQGYNDAMRELKRQFGISDTSSHGGSSSSGTKCPGGVKPTCRGINEWLGQPQFDSWCTTTCAVGECPSNFCSCTCPGAGSWKSGPTCRGVDPAKGASMDTWCTLNCKGGNCPPEMCICL